MFSRPRRKALSLVEAVFSVVIVGGLLVAAMNTVGATATARRNLADKSQGRLLADELMAEILDKDFEDADATDGVSILGLIDIKVSPTLGRESGEAAQPRSGYDDVDDYHGWNNSPPELPDGTEMTELTGWSRAVQVNWVQPTNVLVTDPDPQPVKVIKVTVKRNGNLVTEVTALKTIGLKEPSGGYAALLVAGNADAPDKRDQDRQLMLESWGYQVELITVTATAEEFRAAASERDVMYVPCGLTATGLGDKIKNLSIGTVNEEESVVDELGFATGTTAVTTTEIRITNNSHYITTGQATGNLTVFTSSQPTYGLGLLQQPLGLTTLGQIRVNVLTNVSTLAVLNAGDSMAGGGNAPGRRVMLAWGGSSFAYSALNGAAQTLLQRSVDWAANNDE